MRKCELELIEKAREMWRAGDSYKAWYSPKCRDMVYRGSEGLSIFSYKTQIIRVSADGRATCHIDYRYTTATTRSRLRAWSTAFVGGEADRWKWTEGTDFGTFVG